VTDPRFVVVACQRDHVHNVATAWSIADRFKANRTTGATFHNPDLAQREADKLNAQHLASLSWR
jgi:hypothetical protein